MSALVPAGTPVVVEVRDLHKSFNLPTQKVVTLQEQIARLFRPVEQASIDALRGISFDVHQGEFLGICGRNGSGKTTLLKLMASIYRADAGSIRIAGSLAPIIELGVGFNPNLTARDNVLLNSVMMGLTPKEARRRFDEVIDFAELQDFTELKLKNYSSGMSVRLAFAVMVQSQVDVMLVDEVLAVGDASFYQKCIDTFQRLHDEGRTIVLVTHDMESLRKFCNRAILIEDGVIDLEDEPLEVAHRYLQINFAGPDMTPAEEPLSEYRPLAGRIADVWLEDEEGNRPQGFAHGGRINLVAAIEAVKAIEQPGMSFEIFAGDGARIFATPTTWMEEGEVLEAGKRITFRAAIENALNPGRFRIRCTLSQHGNGFDVVDTRDPGAQFVVYGVEGWGGYVELGWRSGFDRDGSGHTLDVTK
jgi:ABC-type polysaccharide/polyol phosphate transport system ATPase subunit